MFGASSELNINDLDTAENLIQSSNCLITTLVLKPEVSLHSLKLAKKHKCKIVVKKIQIDLLIIIS